jgi:hypothetical protein
MVLSSFDALSSGRERARVQIGRSSFHRENLSVGRIETSILHALLILRC